MKFPCTQFIKCASTDQTRYVLNGAYFDVENERLVVTDGRWMVLLPVVVEEGDVSGIAPTESVVEAMRLAKKTKGTGPDGALAGIKLNGCVELRNGAKFDKVEGVYPNYSQVIPDYVRIRMKSNRTEAERMTLDSGLAERTNISFDARLLHEMAQAMGSDSVTLELVKSRKEEGGVDSLEVIVVRPGSGKDAVVGSVGVLMPMRMS